ncbi:high-affinity glucose transporter [Coccidioides immitis RMSCC 3703]|uniref:High-affinity glucose transporter n=1 Tax=Coccidioides immitis RMSCC 3703 TaxID=454286 RepID=A0A0J8TKD9_COCIT|nr:high-affinity glucose transporter [Coccidioides immitis RMSCC 3703]
MPPFSPPVVLQLLLAVLAELKLNRGRSMDLPAKSSSPAPYLFVASFAPTWGPVSWIYPPELFPLRVRGKAVALCTSANWAFNFALGYFVPPSFVNIQWRTYVLFGVFCATMFIHVFFMFPETAGKTLEEVENIFTKGDVPYVGTPAWRTRVDYRKAAHLEQTGVRDEEDKQAAEHISTTRKGD